MMFTTKRVSVIHKAIITINANLNRAFVVGDHFQDSNVLGGMLRDYDTQLVLEEGYHIA